MLQKNEASMHISSSYTASKWPILDQFIAIINIPRKT